MSAPITLAEKILASRYGAGIFEWKADELWSITGILSAHELAALVIKLNKLQFTPADESERELFNSLVEPAADLLVATESIGDDFATAAEPLNHENTGQLIFLSQNGVAVFIPQPAFPESLEVRNPLDGQLLSKHRISEIPLTMAVSPDGKTVAWITDDANLTIQFPDQERIEGIHLRSICNRYQQPAQYFKTLCTTDGAMVLVAGGDKILIFKKGTDGHNVITSSGEVLSLSQDIDEGGPIIAICRNEYYEIDISDALTGSQISPLFFQGTVVEPEFYSQTPLLKVKQRFGKMLISRNSWGLRGMESGWILIDLSNHNRYSSVPYNTAIEVMLKDANKLITQLPNCVMVNELPGAKICTKIPCGNEIFWVAYLPTKNILLGISNGKAYSLALEQTETSNNFHIFERLLATPADKIDDEWQRLLAAEEAIGGKKAAKFIDYLSLFKSIKSRLPLSKHADIYVPCPELNLEGDFPRLLRKNTGPEFKGLRLRRLKDRSARSIFDTSTSCPALYALDLLAHLKETNADLSEFSSNEKAYVEKGMEIDRTLQRDPLYYLRKDIKSFKISVKSKTGFLFIPISESKNPVLFGCTSEQANNADIIVSVADCEDPESFARGDLSPDMRRFAYPDINNVLQVINLRSGETFPIKGFNERSPETMNSKCTRVCFDKNGKLFAFFVDAKIAVACDPSDRFVIDEIKIPANNCADVFGPTANGSFLFTDLDESEAKQGGAARHKWSVKTILCKLDSSDIVELNSDQHNLFKRSALALVDDGRILASGQGDCCNYMLFDLETGKQLEGMISRNQAIFISSRDGNSILTCSKPHSENNKYEGQASLVSRQNGQDQMEVTFTTDFEWNKIWLNKERNGFYITNSKDRWAYIPLQKPACQTVLRDFLLLDESRLKDRAIEELEMAASENTDDTLKQTFDITLWIHKFRRKMLHSVTSKESGE